MERLRKTRTQRGIHREKVINVVRIYEDIGKGENVK